MSLKEELKQLDEEIKAWEGLNIHLWKQAREKKRKLLAKGSKVEDKPDLEFDFNKDGKEDIKDVKLAAKGTRKLGSKLKKNRDKKKSKFSFKV